jgi:thiol-disulfide isomerase/thioredoxin
MTTHQVTKKDKFIMKKLLVLSLLTMALAGCGSSNNGMNLISKGDRIAAIEIDARFLNSPNLNLSKLKGEVIVLDFWATWCGPCRMEIPSFVKLYPLYHPQGLEIIGLTVEAPSSQPKGYFRDFVKSFAINYPIGFASENTSRAYGIQSIPATYFIDKTGKVAMAFVGTHSEADIQGVIEKLLAEQ